MHSTYLQNVHNLKIKLRLSIRIDNVLLDSSFWTICKQKISTALKQLDLGIFSTFCKTKDINCFKTIRYFNGHVQFVYKLNSLSFQLTFGLINLLYGCDWRTSTLIWKYKNSVWPVRFGVALVLIWKKKQLRTLGLMFYSLVYLFEDQVNREMTRIIYIEVIVAFSGFIDAMLQI